MCLLCPVVRGRKRQSKNTFPLSSASSLVYLRISCTLFHLTSEDLCPMQSGDILVGHNKTKMGLRGVEGFAQSHRAEPELKVALQLPTPVLVV